MTNLGGYELERMDLGTGRKDTVTSSLVYETLGEGPLKPLDGTGWQALHASEPEDSYVMMAGEMIHQALQKENIGVQHNPLADATMLNERFSFAMLACDLSWNAALAAATGFEDRAVRSGHQYLYRISSAKNNRNYPIDTALVLVDTRAPSVLKAPAISETEGRDRSVTIKWPRAVHSDRFTAFHVERSEDAGLHFQRITVMPFIAFTNDDLPGTKDNMTFVDTTTVPYQRYLYRLIGLSPFGIGSPPSIAVPGMARDRTPPKAPLDVKAKQNAQGGITITWNYGGSDPDLKGFSIARGTEVSSGFVVLNKDLLSKSARTFTDPAPQTYLNNYYVVAAIDTAGNPAASFSVLGVVVDSLPPPIPTMLVGAIDTSGVLRLRWRASQVPDLQGYYVFMRNQKDHVEVRLTPQPIGDTLFVDTLNMHTLTEHVYFSVTALDRNDNPSAHTPTLELHRPDMRPPTAPVFTNYSVTKDGIDLQWAPSSSEDVVKHVLMRRAAGALPWDTIAVFLAGSSVAAYTDKEQGSTAESEYTIVAKDDVGLFSAPGRVLRLRALVVDQPASVDHFTGRFDPVDKKIDLDWTYPEKSPERFVVFRSKAHGPYERVDLVSAGGRAWSDRIPETGIEYSYRIQAVDQRGRGSRLSLAVVVSP